MAEIAVQRNLVPVGEPEGIVDRQAAEVLGLPRVDGLQVEPGAAGCRLRGGIASCCQVLLEAGSCRVPGGWPCRALSADRLGLCQLTV